MSLNRLNKLALHLRIPRGMKENERVMDATASSLDKTISFRVPVVYGIIEHSTMDEEGDYFTLAAQCL